MYLYKKVFWKNAVNLQEKIHVKVLLNKFLIILKSQIEITLLRECSPINLLYIFREAFYKNTSGKLLMLVTHTQPISRLIADESNFRHPPQLFSNFYGEILIQTEQPKPEIKIWIDYKKPAYMK